MPFSYLHYDVFTSEPLVGNQLAVVLDGRGLSTERMQAIAREMAFSETTFILPAEQPDTDVRMRIFTPGSELPMAGHPTIGSTFALAQVGVIEPNRRRFVFGLGAGPTPVDLEWESSRLRFAWMTQHNPVFETPVTQRGAVAATVGLEERDFVPDLPVQAVGCGGPVYLMVPLRDKGAVDRAITDASAVAKLKATAGIDRPLYLFTIVSSSPEPEIYSRMFAPEYGIAEDPATGSAAGPLGSYLVRHGLVRGDAARRIVNFQGVAMGRPSRIHIEITERGGEIEQVRVGGEAVLIARGELLI